MVMNRGRAAGFSILGFLLILLMAGFLGLLVIKLFPVYMEHYNVSSSLQSLQHDKGGTLHQGDDVRRRLLRRFSINDVSHVGRKNISVTREANKEVVTVQYEVRKSLFANIDVVVSFNDSISLAKH